MSAPVLSRRALNRATLARQLLLERAVLPALDAVRHLVGMQAQVPLNPYTGLWSRLAGFDPAELSQLLVDRKVVRTVVMRATIHLVTAEDCLLLRPLTQEVLSKELARHPEFAPALRGVDLEPVLAYAREVFAESPRSTGQLRAVLGARFPDIHAGALAYACRCLLPLVQVPPRGVWGQASQVAVTTAEAWLGRPLAERPSIDEVLLRYLGAFGPASVADAGTWSRLTGLREVFERLRPQLVTFRDERGRELFDLPDAPRPDPDTPAPARFLPEYDNVLLSHDDRARVTSVPFFAPGPVHGTVLSDGFVRATWALDGAGLTVRHSGLDADALAGVEAEGRRLLEFLGVAAGEVRLVPA
ncbi:MAG TPA: winged helix DNA-binding domain-containing protein [Acidimicrobiales bacterium]|nr:winged helix DNA-binding domain-containing protein [Acidimicrobiales bacterium]